MHGRCRAFGQGRQGHAAAAPCFCTRVLSLAELLSLSRRASPLPRNPGHGVHVHVPAKSCPKTRSCVGHRRESSKESRGMSALQQARLWLVPVTAVLEHHANMGSGCWMLDQAEQDQALKGLHSSQGFSRVRTHVSRPLHPGKQTSSQGIGASAQRPTPCSCAAAGWQCRCLPRGPLSCCSAGSHCLGAEGACCRLPPAMQHWTAPMLVVSSCRGLGMTFSDNCAGPMQPCRAAMCICRKEL